MAADRISSGISRPSTDLVACCIDATIIGPESISVPSRSNRTTGKRIRSIVVPATCQAGARQGTGKCQARACHLNLLSVADADEVEAVRRRGLSRLGARPAREQAGELLRLALQHRSNQGAHHVAEKGVRRDLEVEMVTALDPRG